MTPERWDRIRELCHAALDIPPDRRSEFLRVRCEDDSIRAEVEGLLSDPESSLKLFESPTPQELLAALRGVLPKPSAPSLRAGQTIGSYEILAWIGAGGMGEVYRARDLKLKREVALKVLPDAFASDAERMARFHREALVLASLNHPNIAQLYGMEDRALAMELVEGENIKGPLALRAALGCARQIAEALEYAHEKGVVHRDLKPANVKITPQGTVKVLDFGLAKGSESTPVPGDPTESPTVTLTDTHAGTIMGTAAYMSPEQAAGKPTDKRSDIWSFGVVLWELITGTRLFQGESVAHTLADVLRAEIDFNRLPEETPAAIRDLLSRCLDRDTRTRLRDLGEARVVIEKFLTEASSASHSARTASDPAVRMRRWSGKIEGIAAAVGLLAVATMTGLFFENRSRPVPGPEHWRGVTNFPDAATDPALSPDGHMLAFMRGEGGWFLARQKQLYVKILPDGPSVQLTHDDLPKMAPTFSPDGSRIAYTGGMFNTWAVSVLAGGAPQLLLQQAEGLTWINPRRVLFSEDTPRGMGLATASESGAALREIYMPQPKGMAHFSVVSPDKKQVLVAEMVGTGPWLPCRLLPLDGSSHGKQVGPASARCTAAAWAPDGRWMYFTANTGHGSHLWRQRVHGGQPEQISFGPSEEMGVAVAPDGRSLFTSVGTGHASMWIHDANGDRLISDEEIVSPSPVFSKDGSRVYYRIPGDLVQVELATGRIERPLAGIQMTGFTFGPDGKSLLYTMRDHSVWVAALDHSSPPRRLPLQSEWPEDSQTSRFAPAVQLGISGKLYFPVTEGGQRYFYSMQLDGTDRRKVFPFPMINTRISPDEQWVVSEVNEGEAARSIHGGTPRPVCKLCFFRWSDDGKSVLLTFRQIGGSTGTTVAIPLKGDAMLPALPPEGVQSLEEAMKLPGALGIPGSFSAVGPGLATYAYYRVTVQQNIFQVPLQ